MSSQTSVTIAFGAEHPSQLSVLHRTTSTRPSSVSISSARAVGTPVRATKHFMHSRSFHNATMTRRRSLVPPARFKEPLP